MKKWNVIVTYDASKCIEVEAETEEQAKEKAYNAAGMVCLCNQCSDELQVGDVLEAVEATEA